MKRIISLALTALLVFFATGCGGSSKEPQPQPSVPAITLSGTVVNVNADGGSTTITLTSNVAWTATVSENWLGINPTSGSGNATVTVTVSKNTGAKRQASVSISDTEKRVTRSFTVVQDAVGAAPITPNYPTFDGNKRSSLTYQLLVYSFADSNGDGIGDFNGIKNKLDYLDNLGVTALWLSPIHPSDSYHGYDVKDYFAVNPLFGTEADFQALVEAAHAKGIKIYIDYVLNHSGKGHPWFTEALSDANSQYRNYYFISTNPQSQYSSFPMLVGTQYNSGEWKVASSGSPKLTITSTTDAAVTGNSNWNIWLWKSGQDGEALKFVDDGNGSYHMVVNLSGSYGMLVRKYLNWETGSKFGAKSGQGNLSLGTPLDLVADGGDISFTGSGNYRIDLTNTNAETVYYMGAFSDWMPDFNYGNVNDLDNNDCFNDLVASAEHWIKDLNIDGFRLDAVKHICGGIASYNNSSNHKLLDKWYQRCNAIYKNNGHSDNIFMVGEVWSGHNEERYYYNGLTSCFEFGYWPLLYSALTNQTGSGYAATVAGFISDHKAIRSDAETSIFMTNHDHSSQTGDGEVRAADDLGKNLAREKQAAAMMLTSGGRPFIYQGEELGYWGNSKNKGDEYLRAPIVWDAAALDCAKNGVNGKVDNTMLKGSISVETQNADEKSLLSCYKYWSRLRNTYSALAKGTMKVHGTYNGSNSNYPSIACWYMEEGSEKLLVVHNTATSEKTLIFTDSLSNPVALLGSASSTGNTLVLGANSSVVFKL